VVDLQALTPEEADPALALLCPVRTINVNASLCRGELCPLGVESSLWRVLLPGVVHSASLADIGATGRATPITAQDSSCAELCPSCVTGNSGIWWEDSSVSAFCTIPYGYVRFSQLFLSVNSGPSIAPQFGLERSSL
ncbi:hypothetical protein M9458_055518, partial [Cirrhinus mrigala]